MAKLSTFVVAMTLSLPATLAAYDGTPLQLIEPQPAVTTYDINHLPATSRLQTLNKCQSAQAKISTKAIDTSDWIAAEGNWEYLSRYTGKSYPTEVKYTYVKDADGNPTEFVRMALTNELFGTAYMETNLVTGDTFSYYDIDENSNPIYPRLNDSNGNSTDMTINISEVPKQQGYGSWGVYPLSGEARLYVGYFALADGELDNSNYQYWYDYLYNTQAKDCKIKADYAKGYYNGEKTAKVSIQRGEGVTDVYYIMGQKIIDWKRTQADPTWNEGSGCYTVSRYLVDEYIAEYKAGESNDAYIVGRVDDSAAEIELPLPDSDGITRMFIVAYSGDQITDMVFDMIEVRRPQEWKSYGFAKLTNDIAWASSEGQSYDLSYPGTYPIEINADGTLYRIVKPFATSENPDANYLYINASLGIDHCYIESSYNPVEHTYYYPALSGEIQSIIRPYLLQDLASSNIFSGFEPSVIVSEAPDLLFDFSKGYSDRFVLFREYNTQLFCEYFNAGVYMNFSAAGNLVIALDNAVEATPDVRYVNFKTGEIVNHIICTFGYGTVPAEIGTVYAESDEHSFRVDVKEGMGRIDIHTLLKENKIPQSPKHIYYTAYDADGNTLRTGDLDLSGYDYSKALCNLEYTYQSSNYFNDAELAMTREDNTDTGTKTFTVENISSTMLLANPGTNISFEVKDDVLTKGIDSFFVDNLYFGDESGYLDVYAEFDYLTYTTTSDGATLTGRLYYICYTADTYELVGYAATAAFTITIPKELLSGMSGIDDPATATDGNDIAPVYYNLQGIRVDNPAAGSILIEAKGNKTRKMIYND